MGISCFAGLDSLPKKPDLAVICTAAEEVPSWVEKFGNAGINEIIIMSAGFKETGEEGGKTEKEIKLDKEEIMKRSLMS